MRCAIYARYSSDLQNERSIEDQTRNCRNHAIRAAWTVLENHVYADRAVSGASLAGRIGLQRLRSAAKSKPKPFDYVLIDDTSRLSRNQADQLEIISEFTYAGVNVNFVSQGIDTANAQALDVLIPVHGITDSLYRRELADKTRRGMAGQVLKGFNPGGRTYGFVYSKVLDPSGAIDKKTGQIRVIGTKIEVDKDKRPIVEEVFSRFAAGHSLKEIAKSLNERRILPPGSSNQRRLFKVSPSWCPNAIRFMLQNRKYVGDWAWNKTRSLTSRQTGKRRYEVRPKDEWVGAPYPHLALISQAISDQVTLRFGENRRSGKPSRGGIQNSYLLSGLLTCQVCGGRYVIVGGGPRNDPLYGCSLNWNRGKSVCSNNLRVKKSEIESVILSDLKGKLLSPTALARLAAKVNERLKSLRHKRPSELRSLGLQSEQIKKSIANILDAIESGAEFSGPLQERLRARQAELFSIESKRATASQTPAVQALTVDKHYVEKWIFQLDRQLRGEPLQARAQLRSLLKNIELKPCEQGDSRYLEAASTPNSMALMMLAAGSSKECNGGGRI